MPIWISEPMAKARTKLIMNRGMALVAIVLSACTPVSGYPPVPVPRAEAVPNPPSSPVPLIWRPGHYEWDGTSYAWVPGAWVDRAGHGTLWQDGYWRREGARYIWIPPHWM